MLRDKDGNRLFRRVQVKIIFPDDILPPKVLSSRADPRQGFGPNGVDAILDDIADQLDVLYPWWQFTLVELIPEGRTARFVFTFAGYRAAVKPEDAVMPAVLPKVADIPNPKVIS